MNLNLTKELNQVKVHLEQLKNVKVNKIINIMQLKEQNKIEVNQIFKKLKQVKKLKV